MKFAAWFLAALALGAGGDHASPRREAPPAPAQWSQVANLMARKVVAAPVVKELGHIVDIFQNALNDEEIKTLEEVTRAESETDKTRAMYIRSQGDRLGPKTPAFIKEFMLTSEKAYEGYASQRRAVVSQVLTRLGFHETDRDTFKKNGLTFNVLLSERGLEVSYVDKEGKFSSVDLTLESVLPAGMPPPVDWKPLGPSPSISFVATLTAPPGEKTYSLIFRSQTKDRTESGSMDWVLKRFFELDLGKADLPKEVFSSVNEIAKLKSEAMKKLLK